MTLKNLLGREPDVGDSLLAQGAAAGAAERWVAQWQGSLKLPAASEVEAADPRLAHLLARHLR